MDIYGLVECYASCYRMQFSWPYTFNTTTRTFYYLIIICNVCGFASCKSTATRRQVHQVKIFFEKQKYRMKEFDTFTKFHSFL